MNKFIIFLVSEDDYNDTTLFEINKTYATIWPNINQKTNPTTTHQQFAHVKHKYKTSFNTNPEYT